MNELESMSEKSKVKLKTKVQKACQTRWLFLDKSVESVSKLASPSSDLAMVPEQGL